MSFLSTSSLPASSPTPAIDLGIDVGSTTVKAAAIDHETGEVYRTKYLRHHAFQTRCVENLLRSIRNEIPPEATLRIALCGSGSEPIARALGVPYVQEVVANAIAVAQLYPRARCAIELGGQDAKMVFFRHNDATGRLDVADMRMNGSCAGGTGAFIDEISALLDAEEGELDKLARQGTTDYRVSGRCGVYAKTDIQPLLNQGVPKTDIARSAFHAIAKQTIGGLAQGLDITPPIIFEGGPLTFNPTLIDVFAERLQLAPDDIIVPDHPETIVATGAALAVRALFEDTATPVDLSAAIDALASFDAHDEDAPAPRFFADAEERADFDARHALPDQQGAGIPKQARTRVFLGVDSGSTTTKLAVVDEQERLLASFYASNEGSPLAVVSTALAQLRDECERRDATLDIAGVGTVGYGEALMAEALGADYHTVETVAHVRAALKYVPDASFVLDIGGQDMKAIWIENGTIGNIVVNEACSSGCGSFLETFAASLGIPTEGIAKTAFSAEKPTNLGSRCTVFMTSSIVTAQRNGHAPADIMAGLCRSIIENVFTKVIRISNLDSLGERVVVQGGTFRNDAVVRAFEQYVEKPVTRAPYPGLMGAIGAALLAKDHVADRPANAPSSFIGLDHLDVLEGARTELVPCPFCTNQCNRTVVSFPNGARHVSGNRCSRGEIIGDPSDKETRERLKAVARKAHSTPDLFALREELLFRTRPVMPLADRSGTVIGIPRVLSFWEDLPFWSTFFRTLGFTVRLSRPSTRAIYESGLPAVTSDTVCFPAKLVHGHVRDLERSGVDRIFMPSMTTVASENTSSTSISMCAVVKGYPIVIRNSDNPERRSGLVFDNPLFHWYTDADRREQISRYLADSFGIPESEAREAIDAGDAAQRAFKDELRQAGAEALDAVEESGSFAVVLASRPYHNDPLVNHDLPRLFADQGVLVLPPDALPGIEKVDLSKSRIDVVNNFHARMLASALIAARSPHLEYAQVVSFNCGHDAYLTDEIARMMREAGSKTPLVLKVDESDATGPLAIRVRSFLETLAAQHRPHKSAQLPDPYPVKFTKRDRVQRTVLVPNTSHAFSRLMTAAFRSQGLRCVSLPIGRDEAIRLGKRYVHNDICFPAQIVIGEALAALESGDYDPDTTAIAMAKYVGDCRLTHYSALLRKALNDAGYERVPIITNDEVDSHDLHPDFKMSLPTSIRIAMTLPMIDILEELLRKMRPYELVPGASERAFDEALDCVVGGLERAGMRGARRGFKRAISLMRAVEYDRSEPRPTVLIVGEYLLNFHPGANHDIEKYLEANGMEIIEARMTDVIQKTYFYQRSQVKQYRVRRPLATRAFLRFSEAVFALGHSMADRIASAHPLAERVARIDEIAEASDPIIPRTFDAGEGILIPAEILHHADRGCKAFVILQPFGCLPNHVVGRGIARKLKELHPDVQILPLDYDPDVSFANIENRLQMLIMNAKAQGAAEGGRSSAEEGEESEEGGAHGRETKRRAS